MSRTERKQQQWNTRQEALPSLYQADDAITSGIRPPAAPPSDVAAVSGEADLQSMDSLDDEPSTTSLDQPSLDPPAAELPRHERRTFPRRPLAERFMVTINGIQVDVEGVDIGRGGLQCQPLPHWARRDDPVLVHLPEPHRQVLGRVAWVQPRSRIEDVVVAGIRFSSPLPFLH